MTFQRKIVCPAIGLHIAKSAPPIEHHLNIVPILSSSYCLTAFPEISLDIFILKTDFFLTLSLPSLLIFKAGQLKQYHPGAVAKHDLMIKTDSYM
ncbi:MAG: hypothetical protein GY874_22965 [Desulfobacteraceae bacterium]|nr:hypothetical protein [Desulfobacteraceae bacterium]